MKKTKQKKVKKCLKCMKEFWRRFDLADEKYLSSFLGAFARIVEVTHFAQIIDFSERAQGKDSPRKVNRQLGKYGNRPKKYDKE